MKRIVKMVLPVMLAVTCIGGVCAQGACAKEVEEEVTFEIPAERVEQGLSDEQIEQVVKDNGYISAEMNADGSVTVTCSKKKGKEAAKIELEGFKKTVKEIIEKTEVTDIKYDEKSFEDFEIITESDGITNNEDSVVNFIQERIEQVHDMRGIKNYEYHIVVKNAKTGEELSRTESSSSSSGFSFSF